MASPAASHHVFRFGGFELDLDAQELRKHGLLIKLNRQPFQILARLLESNGVVVSRKELQDLLWSGEQFGDHDQRLNRAVNKLREALNDSASAPRYLGTVCGSRKSRSDW
jgi:DNA-binding winged helix-turn-helix (wHTH) protein